MSLCENEDLDIYQFEISGNATICVENIDKDGPLLNETLLNRNMAKHFCSVQRGGNFYLEKRILQFNGFSYLSINELMLIYVNRMVILKFSMSI